jgi:outer membrane biosynthesis protein TonB
MRMPRPSVRVLAVVAATALGGVAQAGCGSDEGGLLPRAAASELQADLDAVEAALEAGRCEEARGALSEVRGDLVNLPDSVDEDLRVRLQEGVDNLDQRVATECGQGAQPEETAPQPEETAPQDTGEETTPPEETDTGEETTPPEETDTGEETTPPDTSTDEQPAPEEPGAGGSGSGGTGGASPEGDGG